MSEPTDATYDLWFTEDPAEFLAVASDHLAQDPVLTTVVSSVTHKAVRRRDQGADRPRHPQWWVVVRDADKTVVGAAMRTAPFVPHPLFVLPMPDAAARALAGALHARSEETLGGNGALPAARVWAEETARLAGGTSTVWEHTRLHEIDEVIDPVPVAGRLRLATPADTELCLRWFLAFGAAAAEQAGQQHRGHADEHHTAADMAERIAEERIAIWEVDGTPVHLTGFNPPSFGVARVGPVFTPAEHRGRGYASAAVAEVSRRLLAEGSRVCLFTNQANPTSNKIYEALGYRRVVDMANLMVTTPGRA